jgi:preprotein translocase subunit SecD
MAFNFFLVFAAGALLSGCATDEEQKKKKELSNIRIHVEADQGGDRSSAVSVHRAAPILLNVEREPVLDEHNVIAATVVDQPGGLFSVQLQFDRQGSWLLERASVVNRGKRLVIFSYFGETRWIAAPQISGKNSTGRLTFTPDATREEAERLVRGLNNVARKLKTRENWPFTEPLDK